MTLIESLGLDLFLSRMPCDLPSKLHQNLP